MTASVNSLDLAAIRADFPILKRIMRVETRWRIWTPAPPHNARCRSSTPSASS